MKFVQIDTTAYEKAAAVAELLSQGSATPVSENEAIGMLANLWRGMLANTHHSNKTPDGIVGGPARHKLIAAWCKWRGDPVFLCEILELLGFLQPLDQQKLRIRGASRYWPTIKKNSRPNARTRAKLKKELTHNKARAGQRRASDGPQTGQARAFTSTYRSTKAVPSTDAVHEGGGLLKSVPNVPVFKSPPPSFFEGDPEELRGGSQAFVTDEWRSYGTDVELSPSFVLGWWQAARASFGDKYKRDDGPEDLPSLWQKNVIDRGHPARDWLWAAMTILGEEGVTALKVKARPLVIALDPAVFEQRIPKLVRSAPATELRL